MNYFPPRQATQPCPACGAASHYRKWSRFVNGNYTHVFSQKHTIVGSVMNPLVCTQCGYVQLFVDPTDFRVGPSQ